MIRSEAVVGLPGYRITGIDKYWDGISRSGLGQRGGIGSATVERWLEEFLKRRAARAWGCVIGVVVFLVCSRFRQKDLSWRTTGTSR